MERTKQRTKIKESTGERIFTGVIYAILILFCAMVVATLPIMCLYPFLQKYFVKGVMIGAVKG